MRAREVVGRKIVAIRQERFYSEHLRHMTCNVVGLVLDSGTVLVPVVDEGAGDYYVDFVISKPTH